MHACNFWKMIHKVSTAVDESIIRLASYEPEHTIDQIHSCVYIVEGKCC